MATIIHRGDKFDDSSCSNAWRWEWISVIHKIKCQGGAVREERVGMRFRKLDVPGQALCILCNKQVQYGSRGLVALTDHLTGQKHLKKSAAVESNQRMPGTEPQDATYGMDPVLKATSSDVQSKEKPVTLTSVKDRTSNLEALTLAFAAEKGLSLSSVPDLIEYAKAASLDRTALNNLHMDRSTASYKLREGLAPYLQETLIEELKTAPFSLNIDEAISETNQKVLAVLVSHFSPSANKVLVNHLGAVALTTVTAKAFFDELDRMFTRLGLSWNNLVSVLMDSCAVMRGEKNGLEKLMRDKVVSLLNIDGDTCHHAHNAAKQFCQPFGGHAEAFMKDLHTDFKWSQELRDKFFDICRILGIKPTTPERYVPHRWLSVLDVSLDTLRLFDAYAVFYYSFLCEKDRNLYADIVAGILEKREVLDRGRRKITELQGFLRKKFASFTKDGKERKARLTEKCFNLRIDTLSILEIFVSILPSLKKYVVFFQRKEPSMHLLHEKQHELFNEFCGKFLTPEALTKLPHQVVIEDPQNQKSEKAMTFPSKALDLLETSEGISHKKKIIHKLKEAYIACALSLQRKMPVNNPILKGCAALDWTIRRTSITSSYLKALANVTVTVTPVAEQKSKKKRKEQQKQIVHVLVNPSDREAFENEVDSYVSSPSIPKPASGTSIDVFWAQVDATRYPLLTGIAKKLLSAFHGPAVESSFSSMGEILHAGCSRMDIDTYSAIQGIRYFLATNKTTAVKFFSKKNPVSEPISKKLTKKMQKSWTVNNERKDNNRQAENDRRVGLGAPVSKPATKTAEKKRILEEGQMHREEKASSRKLEKERKKKDSSKQRADREEGNRHSGVKSLLKTSDAAKKSVIKERLQEEEPEKATSRKRAASPMSSASTEPKKRKEHTPIESETDNQEVRVIEARALNAKMIQKTVASFFKKV